MFKKKIILAQIISHTIHPFFIPTVGAFFLSRIFSPRVTNLYSEKLFIGCVFFLTAILPLLIAIVFVKNHKISNLKMPLLKERRLILPFAFVCNLCGLLIMHYIKVPLEVICFFVGCLLSVFFAYFLSFFLKVSLHMLGVGSAAGAFIVLSFFYDSSYLFYALVAIILSGLVAWSRLHLKAHTLAQITCGFFVAFFCEIGVFCYYFI